MQCQILDKKNHAYLPTPRAGLPPMSEHFTPTYRYSKRIRNPVMSDGGVTCTRALLVVILFVATTINKIVLPLPPLLGGEIAHYSLQNFRLSMAKEDNSPVQNPAILQHSACAVFDYHVLV